MDTLDQGKRTLSWVRVTEVQLCLLKVIVLKKAQAFSLGPWKMFSFNQELQTSGTSCPSLKSTMRRSLIFWRRLVQEQEQAL
jgi:hypothetical protein